MSKKLIQGTAILSFAAGISAVLNFFFYTVGKILGPSEFGVLVSLVSLSFVISIIQTAVSNFVTREVASMSDDSSGQLIIDEYTPLLRRVQYVLAIFIIIIGAFFLQSFLKVDSILPFVMLSIIALSGVELALYRGILQGKMKYVNLASTQIFESTLKLVTAFAATVLGFGVVGIILGLAISSFATLLLAKRLAHLSPQYDSTREINYYVDFKKVLLNPVAIGFVLLNLMFIIDTLIVRNILTEFDSGIYGAIITFGKLIFFFANSVTLAMFPMSSKSDAKLTILIESLGLTTIIGSICIFAYALFGELATSFIFGSEYKEVPSFLTQNALIMTILAMLSQTAAFMLARGSRILVVILLGLISIQIIVLLAFGTSVKSVLDLQLGVMSFGLVVMLIYSFIKRFIDGRS